MRRALVFAGCVAAAWGVFVACSDEDPSNLTDAGGNEGGTLPPGEGGPVVGEDAGFQGISATVDGVSASYVEQRAAYGSSAGDLTTMRAFRDPLPFNAGHGVVLTIDAERPGTYPCALPGATMALYRDDAQEVRYGALVYEDGGARGSCSITITAYGDVASFIEGTFEGTLRKTAGPPAVPAQVTITNGRFRLRRNIDE
jgi:hypothetical protein